MSDATRVMPAWARWAEPAVEPWTVGIEEEVMLLDPTTHDLASRIDAVLAAAPPDLLARMSQETHGSAVELATAPHARVPDAMLELAALRRGLAATLDRVGLAAAAAGTHPFASWHDVHVSAGARQQQVLRTMRELARREPTFALHVHVAVPDPELALRAMNRMRAHVPLLLALSANSPFWQGRDSGLASARTPLFQAFPRSGLPRAYESYGELVEATDGLIRPGAIPEPTFIWWDLRLQPRFGTLEMRVMDAQTTVAETAALTALVQALVYLECSEEGFASPALVDSPEILDENRFLALRDGVGARLVDPDAGKMVGVPEILDRTLDACAPVSARLGSDRALAAAENLVRTPGAERQRAAAAGPRGLISLVRDLADRFC